MTERLNAKAIDVVLRSCLEVLLERTKNIALRNIKTLGKLGNIFDINKILVYIYIGNDAFCF